MQSELRMVENSSRADGNMQIHSQNNDNLTLNANENFFRSRNKKCKTFAFFVQKLPFYDEWLEFLRHPAGSLRKFLVV